MNGVIHYKDWQASYIPQILEEIWIRQVYAPYLHNRKDLTILDLGLNIGLFSMYATQFAKQIYAFEPAKETIDLARKNIDENEIKNVKLFQEAISIEDGEMPFYHSTNTTANSLSEALNQKPELKEMVKTTRLDTFVKKEGITKIDFAKIDIEGEEGKVIGSKSFENIVPILDAFVMEWHSWAGMNVQQIVTTIRDYGYNVEVIPAEATILGCVKR